jgi:hypothetical protein
MAFSSHLLSCWGLASSSAALSKGSWSSRHRMSALQVPPSARLPGKSSSSWKLGLPSMSSGSRQKGRTCAAASERLKEHSRAQRLWYTNAVLPVKLGVAAVDGRRPCAGVLKGLQPAVMNASAISALYRGKNYIGRVIQTCRQNEGLR